MSAGAGEHIRGTAIHGFALDFAIGRDDDALIRFLAAVLGFAIETNGAELGGGAGGIAIVNGVSGERGIDLKGESKAAAVDGGFAELEAAGPLKVITTRFGVGGENAREEEEAKLRQWRDWHGCGLEGRRLPGTLPTFLRRLCAT